MRKRAVVFVPRALKDLAEIQDYIGKDHPKQATAWLDHFDQAAARLADFPESAAIPKDKRLAARGYRMLVIGEHLAFYVIREDRIEIRRVLHGKRRYWFILD